MSLHCLRYLQFFSLRPESTDDEIKADILRGEYLWLEYVESNWLDHIRSGSKVDSVKLNELIHYLRQFLARWQKDASHDYNSSNMPLTFSLDTFRDCSPDVYRKLVRVALHQSQGHISSNHPDPLVLRDFSTRVWKQFDHIVSQVGDENGLERLSQLYGHGLFKCDMRTCPFFGGGFTSKVQRDRHTTSHRRPFKCRIALCEYAHFGFATTNALERHMGTHAELELVVKDLSNLHLSGVASSAPKATDAGKLFFDAVSAEDYEQVLATLNNEASLIHIHYRGSTALFAAVRTGSTRIVKALLERGAAVNKKNMFGSTPLMHVSPINPLEMVRLLLAHGADAEIADNYGLTPLMRAAWSLSVETTQLLLDHGVNVNAQRTEISDRFSGEFTALAEALQYGSVEVVQLLLEHGAKLATEDLICTTLFSAVWGDSTEKIRLVLEYGVDVNTRMSDGLTALIIACQLNPIRMEAVRALLGNGANANTRTNDGSTALIEVCRATPIRMEVVRVLLESGASVNTMDGIGRTALSWALSGGSLEAILALIEHGAYVNTRTNDGSTALHVASSGNDLEAIQVLIEHGVDVNTRMNDGSTALIRACQLNPIRMEAVRALLGNGANANTRTNDGSTALIEVCRATPIRMEVVRVLLENGASVDTTDSNGRTAVYFASEATNLEAVRVLVEHGCDVNRQDGYGRTPLMCGVTDILRRRAIIMKVLIEAGADPSIGLRSGKTVSDYAITKKFLQWTGMSWDGLVKANQHKIKKPQPPMDLQLATIRSLIHNTGQGYDQQLLDSSIPIAGSSPTNPSANLASPVGHLVVDTRPEELIHPGIASGESSGGATGYWLCCVSIPHLE
ncbi:MAG: hypothetical protein M1813_001266 [Trichoglossum hirsutum]|nr:MAG: hypothetical protein M1813_001266 [Trichoglossum hirsutum]